MSRGNLNLADGLQPYLDTNYQQFGGYTFYTECLTTGKSDSYIARKYQRTRQAVGAWRVQYLVEQGVNVNG